MTTKNTPVAGATSAVGRVLMNNELLGEISMRCDVLTLANLLLTSKTIRDPVVQAEFDDATRTLPSLLSFLPEGLVHVRPTLSSLALSLY